MSNGSRRFGVPDGVIIRPAETPEPTPDEIVEVMRGGQPVGARYVRDELKRTTGRRFTTRAVRRVLKGLAGLKRLPNGSFQLKYPAPSR